MSYIVLGFHGADCNGRSHETCLGFVAHADSVPDAVQRAFDAGLPASQRWRIRATDPMPDHWIRDEFVEEVMPFSRLVTMPEPEDSKRIRNARWN